MSVTLVISGEFVLSNGDKFKINLLGTTVEIDITRSPGPAVHLSWLLSDLRKSNIMNQTLIGAQTMVLDEVK